jgi:hypothetical protein
LTCISDNRVRSWFATNTYFDRSKFNISFAQLDTIRLKYRLFLCSVGSSLVDRWVEYDLSEGTWWGVHQTDAFSPSCAFQRVDASNVIIPTIGSGNGYLWQEQDTRTDNTSAISWRVTTKRHFGENPHVEKVWTRPYLQLLAQPAGSLTLAPLVGELNAVAGVAKTASLTVTAQKLTHMGRGKHAGITFTHAVVGQNVQLLGYELPYVETGERL